jgi:hypothetical protein
MRLLLTDRFCARAKSQGAAQTDYFDESVKGLALRVGAKRKTWTLHRTGNGKRQRLTLGQYPAMSLGAARAFDSWRRDVGAAAKADRAWVRAIFEMARNGT